jgi:prepilin-type N-terminal cleavage/methylation domain-containing protein
MSLRQSHPFYAAMRSRVTSDGGFTLVEVMAAMGIILLALLALGYTATIGFSDVALARQRQGANSLANQTMEQVRALPFDTLKRGLANNDLTGDTHITQCGSPAVSCYAGEWLVRGDNPNVVPLVPHRQNVTVGPTLYKVSTYVTYYQNNVTTDTYRVTVLVSWANPARNGVDSQVVTQSIFFSGAGCLSTATHPFAGPCQPFLYANASVDTGRVEITGTVASLGLEHATLSLPSVTSNMQIEQVSAVQGSSQTAGVALKVSGLDEQVIGVNTISSKSDTDPAQSGTVYDKKQIPPPPQVGGTLTRTVAGNTLSVSLGAGGDTAATTSTTSALVPTYPCPDRNGVNRNDQQPCGNSNERLAPQLSANLSLVTALGLNLGAAPLVTIDPPGGSLPTRVAFTNRDLTHEAGEPAGECPSTSGDGCVHADAYRNMGDIKLGDILGALKVLAPLQWAGYLVRINPGTALVSADAGTGASAPSATFTGTINYWNKVLSRYDNIPSVAAVGSLPQTITTSITQLANNLLFPGVTLDLSATITQGTASIDDPAGCATPCTRTSATAVASSPVIDLTYRVKVFSTTLADLNVHLDLGAVLAQNTYKQAPSGA